MKNERWDYRTVSGDIGEIENSVRIIKENSSQLSTFRLRLNLRYENNLEHVVNHFVSLAPNDFRTDYQELTFLYFTDQLNKDYQCPKCPICGELCKFLVNRYRKTCGNSNCALEKSMKTTIEKHGGLGLGSDTIKNKIHQTNFKKYGAENVFASEYGKRKIKETNLKRFGVEHNWNLGSPCRETYRQTMLELYGVEHNWNIGSPSWKTIHDTRYEKLKEKYKRIIEEQGLGLEIIENERKLVCRCIECNETFEIKGVLWTRLYRYAHLKICPHCNPIGSSSSESELFNFVKSIYGGNVVRNYRKWSGGKYEIDIYLPELKIGFEFNGTYWHSKKHKDQYYHFNKSMNARQKGISIVHIHENDWYLKNEIVKNKIKECLGIYDEKIDISECYNKEISDDRAEKFLNENHIKGYIDVEHHFGLFKDDILISVMSIEDSEIVRYCDKIGINVNSFKKFFSDYHEFMKIVYIDLDYPHDVEQVKDLMEFMELIDPIENEFECFNSGFFKLTNQSS